MDKEITSIFYGDIKSKARAATGDYSRATRKRKGRVMLPMDYLSGNDDYIKPSPVKVYYVITTTLDEFQCMDDERKRETIQRLLSRHTLAEIAKAWGLTPTQFLAYLADLKLDLSLGGQTL